jgi:hypothetical protein
MSLQVEPVSVSIDTAMQLLRRDTLSTLMQLLVIVAHVATRYQSECFAL